MTGQRHLVSADYEAQGDRLRLELAALREELAVQISPRQVSVDSTEHTQEDPDLDPSESV